MTPIMKRTEKDDAVSPVVGVMLMLVVTIIIAAVVAAFASGVAGDTEKVPSVMLSAAGDSTFAFNYGGDYDGTGTVFLSSLGGDSLDLTKVAVKITYPLFDESGNGLGTFSTFVYDKPSLRKYTTDPTHLKSGETINLGYGIDSTGNGIALSAKGVTLKSNTLIGVQVIYDNSHILFDKEVLVS